MFTFALTIAFASLPGVTPENYGRIELGITRWQVMAILGGLPVPAAKVSQYERAGLLLGQPTTVSSMMVRRNGESWQSGYRRIWVEFDENDRVRGMMYEEVEEYYRNAERLRDPQTTSSHSTVFETIKPTKQWTGIVEEEKLAKEQPGNDGLVTDKDAFAKLWKAWMPNEKMPDIDFDKQFVIVDSDSKSVAATVFLSGAKGNFGLAGAGKEKNFDKGFSFVIAVFDREGIKTLGGEALKK
jgi:hypothetical protein